MLHTEGLTEVEGLGGGLNVGSLGGGGLEVGGGFTVGFTGTIGFSVSVEGTGGQTLFSNLTTDPGRSSEWLGLMLAASLGLVGDSLVSHIFFKLEIDPVLFLLSSLSSSLSISSLFSFSIEF